jgi:hypothetical protein
MNMKMLRALFPVVLVTLLAGCATVPAVSVPQEPVSSVRELCEKGEYHATAEGTAGYLYALTMFTIAEKGDAHWGKILDDPDIPYVYKTEMVFEILEARLGEGAVYVANRRNLIVPRMGVIDLDKEMIKLSEEGSIE